LNLLYLRKELLQQAKQNILNDGSDIEVKMFIPSPEGWHFVVFIIFS
jgi:hypothetical protein